jgi:membrane dipeptidase
VPLLIDAHLDLAWNALSFDRDLTEPVTQINAREQGMTDSPARGHATVGLCEMRRGSVAICVATLLAHNRPDLLPHEGPKRISLEYRSASAAYAIAQGQLAYYRLLEQQGHVVLLNSAEGLQSHWDLWTTPPARDGDHATPLGLILGMEGADAIVDPSQAQAWFDQGLRIVGPVHYGHNQYAVGTGESGPLTKAGIALLGELERLGCILDATHLSDPSFFQALDVFGGAVIASHQNCRALVPGDRQFSDEQLRLLIERDAVIGAAFDNWMLVPNWKTGQSSRSLATLERIADHVDYICQMAGNQRHVAIGTDLDGGYGSEQSPVEIDTIAHVQRFADVLERRGYDAEAINAIYYGNWLRVFSEHLPCIARETVQILPKRTTPCGPAE